MSLSVASALARSWGRSGLGAPGAEAERAEAAARADRGIGQSGERPRPIGDEQPLLAIAEREGGERGGERAIGLDHRAAQHLVADLAGPAGGGGKRVEQRLPGDHRREEEKSEADIFREQAGRRGEHGGGEQGAEDEAGQSDQQQRIEQDMRRRAARPLLFQPLEQQALVAEAADRDGELDRGDGERIGAEQDDAEQPRSDVEEGDPGAEADHEAGRRRPRAAHDHPPGRSLLAHPLPSAGMRLALVPRAGLR